MNIEDDLDNASHSAATEYIRDRLVIIGDGTGNMLNVNNRNFIVTCKHVAEPFFENRLPYVVLRHNIRISIDNLELIGTTDNETDIALVEVKSEINNRGVYTIEDFEIIDDFSKYQWNDSFCFICGFPAGLAFKNELGFFYPYYSFTSSYHKTVSSGADFLFLEYDKNKEGKVLHTNLQTIIPDPAGISGSFILKVTKSNLNIKEIWTPNQLKVIAIQHRWHRDQKFIKGSNINLLLNLLKMKMIL